MNLYPDGSTAYIILLLKGIKYSVAFLSVKTLEIFLSLFYATTFHQIYINFNVFEIHVSQMKLSWQRGTQIVGEKRARKLAKLD